MNPIIEIRLMLTALLLMFVTLKLIGTIDWSWWWVLAPLWGPASVGLVGLMLQGVAWLLMSPKQRAAKRAAQALRDLQAALNA